MRPALRRMFGLSEAALGMDNSSTKDRMSRASLASRKRRAASAPRWTLTSGKQKSGQRRRHGASIAGGECETAPGAGAQNDAGVSRGQETPCHARQARFPSRRKEEPFFARRGANSDPRRPRAAGLRAGRRCSGLPAIRTATVQPRAGGMNGPWHALAEPSAPDPALCPGPGLLPRTRPSAAAPAHATRSQRASPLLVRVSPVQARQPAARRLPRRAPMQLRSSATSRSSGQGFTR